MSVEPITRTVRVEGRPARLLEAGAGPPVVFVHGLGLTADVWTPHLSRLAALGYRGIAPDLPGFGRSPGPRTGRSVSATAAWLEGLADALSLDDPAWVGHSVATQQLARLAASRPRRVGALVLAAPTGRTGRHAFGQIVGLARTAPRERPSIVAGVVRRYLFGPLTALGTWLRSQSHDIELDAVKIRAPTLIVVGERDPLVPDAFGPRLQRLIPDALLERIVGAAHAGALDPAPVFIDAVGRFLVRRYRSGERTERWKSSGIASKSHGSSGP